MAYHKAFQVWNVKETCLFANVCRVMDSVTESERPELAKAGIPESCRRWFDIQSGRIREGSFRSGKSGWVQPQGASPWHFANARTMMPPGTRMIMAERGGNASAPPPQQPNAKGNMMKSLIFL